MRKAGLKSDEDIIRFLAADLATRQVPKSPLSKNWHELVLKRMIQKAAEEGYDAIGWAPGHVHTERYSLGDPKGMAKFYDEKLVNTANQLSRKYGGEVGKGRIDLGVGQKGPGIGKKQFIDAHILDLNPKIKEVATGKGFPLFMGGFPVVPVDHDPFKDQNMQ
jgi:hypothetical protein